MYFFLLKLDKEKNYDNFLIPGKKNLESSKLFRKTFPPESYFEKSDLADFEEFKFDTKSIPGDILFYDRRRLE